jgi:hypothetical protein
VEQGVEPRGRLRRQPCQECRAEGGIVAVHRRSDQPAQALGRGRLDPQPPASLPGRQDQAIRPPIVGDLAFEPAAQGLSVLERGLAEAEGAADLGAVVLGRAATPGVTPPLDRRHADLPGDRLHRRGGHALAPARKPTFGLGRLQEHREAQARGAALVGQERAFGLAQRPTLVDLFRLAVQHPLVAVGCPT